MQRIVLTSALVLFAAACSKGDGDESGAKKITKGGKAYALAIKAPATGKVGQSVEASISLKPLGEYKVNMEYPLRLTVKGPEAATPRKVVMRAKDAKKMTKAQVLLLPQAKLAKAGEHAFEAEFRFSVCTEKHCELKTEKLSWKAKVD